MINFGTTPADFRAAHCERGPWLLRGALSDAALEWSDIDALLHALEPGAPITRLFHHGELAEDAYIQEFMEAGQHRRRFDKAKFLDLMSRGATLQINWIERFSVLAQRLCLEVARFTEAQTSANAYMSFSGDGTFGPHWDTHDVFAAQLLGRKQWRIFEPTFPLPLSYQTHDKSGQHCPAQPAMELTLEAGDVLYLPRGWWHHVVPLAEGSFHISVGCYAPTMFDFIVQSAAKVLERLPAARRSFAAGDVTAAVPALLEALGSALTEPAAAAAFTRDAISRERQNAEFNLATLDAAAPPFGDATRISLTTHSQAPHQDGVVSVNGQQFRIDPISLRIVDALGGPAGLDFGALCARLPDIPAPAMRSALLNLARHDLVTIMTVKNNK